MIDKYEAHNKRVMDGKSKDHFFLVIDRHFYDIYEQNGRLNLLNHAVVSTPLSAMVRYPRAKGRNTYQSLRIGKRRIIRKK